MPGVTRGGHTFAGWYTDAAFSSPFNPASTITGALTLHARWNLIWVATSVGYPNTTSITFQFSGPVSGLTVSDITLEPSATGIAPNFLEKGELTQVAPNEWSLAISNGGGLVLASIDKPGISTAVQQLGTICESVDFFNFVRITFNTAGGDPLPPMDIDDLWSVFTLETNDLLPTLTRAGYVFDGWDWPTLPNTWTRIHEDTTAVAVWVPQFLTVSFDMQGATSAQASPQTVEHGSFAAAPPNPTRTGLIFAGWSLGTTGTFVFDFETQTITGHTTLFARWRLANWTAVQAGTGVGQSTFASNQAINDIAYGSGTFIAVGAGGRMARSTNGGQNWTPIDPGTGAGQSTFAANQSIQDIAYGSGTFIAVGSGGRMARSTDGGRNWMPIESGQGAGQSTFAESFLGIAYGNGTFIATGFEHNRVARSTDGGLNWVPSTTPSEFYPIVRMIGPMGSIAYGNGTFIAGGFWGSITRSTTSGQTWINTLATMNQATTPTGFVSNFTIWGIAHGGNTFVAVGDGGRMSRSANGGQSWTGIPLANNANIFGITYGNGSFVAVGAGGLMSYSLNYGVNWTQIGHNVNSLERSTFANNQAINGIAHGSGRFIAVGANGKMSIGVQD
jgi:uncharacterized repeat protein (TIGR02543 family)